jgi:hypothetical protein
MKKLLFLSVFFFPLFVWGQVLREVNILDSFTCTNLGQGVHGLSSVMHNGATYLGYIEIDKDYKFEIKFAVDYGSGFEYETVETLADYNSYYTTTAIQFGPDNEPILYVGHLTPIDRFVKAFQRIDGNWEKILTIDEGIGDTPFVVAPIDAPDGPEFLFFGDHRYYTQTHLIYAKLESNGWNFETVSEVQSFKNKPSLVRWNNDLYVIFGEGRAPDTLLTRVYKRENSQWKIDFEDLYQESYFGGSIYGFHTRMGISDGKLQIAFNLHYKEDQAIFYEKSAGTWMKREFDYQQGPLIGSQWKGSNLLGDDRGNTFILSQDNGNRSRISWITREGKADLAYVPFYHGVALWDFVMDGDLLKVYYYDGVNVYPWGRPITFKEAVFDISTLSTRVFEPPSHADFFNLYPNRPNPFFNGTIIPFELRDDSEVQLQILDARGNLVQTLVNGNLHAGKHEILFYAAGLPQGLYYCSLRVDGIRKTMPMIYQ